MDEPVLMPVIDRTPQHATHDPFAIAQLAADDLRPTERARATELVATCRSCAGLLADLRSIANATVALPALPAAARPRDFRLTDADAARLRRGAWRRWFGFARSRRLAFTQPLGVGLATIGLAGLLVSGGAFGFASSATSVPAPEAPAAVRPAPASDAADPGASADGGEFTSRSSTDATPSTVPAAAGASEASGAPQAPGGADASAAADGAPAGSPTVELMAGSPAPEDSTKIAAPPADAMPVTGDGTAAGSTEGDDAADATAPAAVTQPASQTGWLALLVAGVALVVLRPLLARLARR